MRLLSLLFCKSDSLTLNGNAWYTRYQSLGTNNKIDTWVLAHSSQQQYLILKTCRCHIFFVISCQSNLISITETDHAHRLPKRLAFQSQLFTSHRRRKNIVQHFSKINRVVKSSSFRVLLRCLPCFQPKKD